MSFKYGVHTGTETWETETSLEKWNIIHCFNIYQNQINLKFYYSLESPNKLLQIMIWKFQLTSDYPIYMDTHVIISLNLTKSQKCPIAFSNVFSQDNIIENWIFTCNLDTGKIIMYVHYKP